MRDGFARKIDYMRVSITDRCNLRCIYCMPEDVPHICHNDIMRYEELLRLCGMMAKLGIQTVRITGGEPLVRKGWLGFVKSLKNTPGIEHVSLTTNAVLLDEHLEDLADIGLDGLNISLDALCPDIYREITGFDAFHRVWGAINTALELGLRVKLNCVPIQGVNDCQIRPLAALAQHLPLDVRFIELMPTGITSHMKGVPAEEILEHLKDFNLRPDDAREGFGPAKYYVAEEGKGGIGLISALSEGFCAECNRVRLSSDGFLLLCLHHNRGLDLRQMLRGGASSEDALARAIVHSINQKPEKHALQTETELENMSKIGG